MGERRTDVPGRSETHELIVNAATSSSDIAIRLMGSRVRLFMIPP